MQSELTITLRSVSLEGFLDIPLKPQGLVFFVHGSGSSRFSPRNTLVAEVLQKAHFATLLIDLLSLQEDASYDNRFDMNLLTSRVEEIIHWIQDNPKLKDLPIGLFGASTGAAAALMASTRTKIQAIVARGGRPDLAESSLKNVQAPTLFIVGEKDREVLLWNQEAFTHLSCEKKLEIVPLATHLFEEKGCLEIVANLAKNWFIQHLPRKLN